MGIRVPTHSCRIVGFGLVIIAELLMPPRLILAQGLPVSPEARSFVSVDTPVVVLTHVRVIDGTASPAREDQTIVLTRGTITALGDAGSVPVPSGAQVLELPGHTVLPGYVMLHEHLFYTMLGTSTWFVANEEPFSFPRLYLAGGATTIRTGGSLEPYTDLNLRAAIDSGRIPGPDIDVTGPYLEGPGLPALYQVHALRGPDDARKMVEYWAEAGVTSFKAYTDLSRAELKAAIDAARRRGLKVTGHLCSVTFREAAQLGIDDLEHGLLVSTDFVPNKQPDQCPPQNDVVQSLLALDLDAPAARDLIRELVSRGVAVTSTLPVFETFAAQRPPLPQRVLDVMSDEAKINYLRRRSILADRPDSTWAVLLRKEMDFERAFAQAGGLLLAGTDPTGYGGVVAGFSNQREVELLVEAGFTPVEAIRIATLNGARYLSREARIGTLATGKQADLIVVRGDPSTNIQDIENVEIVFKRGVGYDPAKLIESVRGHVGVN